ncbi:MAG: carbohydrate-binding domain-containing protein [Butyrivibrio sp.]|nr:carbohydrate-binding domain-containing protein [Butyrivibrio sp.]
MRRKTTIGLIAALASLTLVFTACSSTTETASTQQSQTSETTEAATNEETTSDQETTGTEVTYLSTTSSTSTDGMITDPSTLDLSSMFTSRDLETGYDESTSTTITLNTDSVEVSGSGATADGTTVTITEEGTYILSGELSDGQIIVEAEDTTKVQLVLNGVTITNDDSACIYIKSADKVFITLASGTTNTLSDTGSEYVQSDDNNVDGVIFAKSDVTFNGSGTLIINAGYDHGIVGKDDLKFTGGTYEITSTGHAIVANDSVRIKDGTFTLTSGDGKDGIQTSNEEETGKGYIYIEGGNITITSGDDGIHAATALIITGGTIDIKQSYEGIEGDTIDITGGDISVVAEDDGLNASTSTAQETNDWTSVMDADENAYIRISGGTIYVNAGGDGLDSNGMLYVEGGTVYVDGPVNSANGAIDTGYSATISGGTVAAAGASGMVETFDSDSTQYSISYTFESSVSGGTEVTLTDSEGNVIFSYTPSKDFQNIVISTADISEGTYTISAGDLSEEVTVESISTSAGASQGMGMGGFGQGGMGGGRGQMDEGGAPSGEMPSGSAPSGEMPSGGPTGEMPGTQTTEGSNN